MTSNYWLKIQDTPDGLVRTCISDWGEREVNDGLGLEVNGKTVQHMAVVQENIPTLMDTVKRIIQHREEGKRKCQNQTQHHG